MFLARRKAELLTALTAGKTTLKYARVSLLVGSIIG
jgi:hypothetical protein